MYIAKNALTPEQKKRLINPVINMTSSRTIIKCNKIKEQLDLQSIAHNAKTIEAEKALL